MPRERTPKQLLNDQRMRDEAKRTREENAAKASGGVAVLEREPEPLPEPEDDSVDVSEMFGQASRLFQKAQVDGRLTRSELNQLEDILEKIDPLKYPEIADNPTVNLFLGRMMDQRQKSTDIAPGTVFGNGLAVQKKTWQVRDVVIRMSAWIEGTPYYEPDPAKRDPNFEPVSFVPRETIPVGWNGITIVVEQDMPATLPKCVYLVLAEHYTAMRSGQQHKEIMFRSRDSFDPRQVQQGLIDPSILGDATKHVRAVGEVKLRRPIIDGVGGEFATDNTVGVA